MKNQKVVIVMPAYNAAKTLDYVWQKIPHALKPYTILIDDNSSDNTLQLAKKLHIESYVNEKNLGYGGNVKACLTKALAKGADIIIEMHPDNEYDPGSILPAIACVQPTTGMVLGNRYYYSPLKSGMYIWKYIPNRIITAVDNLFLGTHITDLHQGFRLYTRQFLEKAQYQKNANSFLFSFEIIAQAVFYKYSIEEVPVKTHYTGKKRGATLKNTIIYTLGTCKVLILFVLSKMGFKTYLFK